MRVAIVGAGALGSVYGARLARVAEVTFVVRDLQRAPRSVRVELVTGPDRDALEPPTVGREIPGDAAAVLVAVRVDQLDDALWEKIAREASPEALVVVLAPLLPHRRARARAIVGARLVAAMPGVIAYEPEPATLDRRVRYWTPRVAPTLLEELEDPWRARVGALVAALRAAGLPADTSPQVASVNAAVTVALFPMLTGIAAGGGSIDRMLADGALMKLGVAATKETRALAKTLGPLPAWASLFLDFGGPRTARLGIALGRARAPEVLTFLERHFGDKLAAQNHALFAEIEALAAERGLPVEHLRQLVERTR